MTDKELNESIKNKIEKIAGKLYLRANKLLGGLSLEKKETQDMLKTFFLQLRDKLKGQQNVSDDDIKAAIMQLKDLGKLSVIAPIFMLPGGGTTTAVLYMMGKKFFNISILPDNLEPVFENVQFSDLILIEEIIVEEKQLSLKDFERLYVGDFS